MKIQYIFYIIFVLLVITPLQAVGGQSGTYAEEQVVSKISVDQLSPEEKEWFVVFQEGTLFVRGWKEITAEILAKTPVELKEKQRIALEQLGVKIGCEWSKDNDIRKIDNKMLQKWGRLLNNTAGENPYQLKEVIAEIDQKVGELFK